MMRSATPKPTSRFGQADANGVYRWEGGFLWWEQSRTLVTRHLTPMREKMTCPQEVLMNANYALAAVERCFFDDEETFYRGTWPRAFQVVKSRFDNTVGSTIMMSKLDFRMMLIG